MIEVASLTKRYGATVALRDLSFTVRPGRVTGFLGPNGAGKSTAMRVILGLDAPDSGSATVLGKPYRDIHWPAYHVGALLDATAIHGGRTALQHLRCIARSNGIGLSRVIDVMEEVGLESVARRRVGGFSLGMKQRLGIGVALLGDPPVLMFDEPINGLDPEGIAWIRRLLKDLAAQGRTVLVSSHVMSEVAQTADHLVIIGAGELISDAPLADVLGRGVLARARVRSPQPAELARLLLAHGATVHKTGDDALAVTGLDCAAIGELAGRHQLFLHELVAEQPSLEEAFMELTSDSVEYARCPTTAEEARS